MHVDSQLMLPTFTYDDSCHRIKRDEYRYFFGLRMRDIIPANPLKIYHLEILWNIGLMLEHWPKILRGK